MKIIYATLEGTDDPWIEEELKRTLKWISDYQFGPEFWGRLDAELNHTMESTAFAECALRPDPPSHECGQLLRDR